MSLKKKIHKLLHPQSAIADTIHSVVQNECQNVIFQIRKNELQELALHSTDLGITKEKICDEEIVVSLTTFGGRLFDAYVAVESIMQGSVKPNRIVMWISEDFKNIPLPLTLQNQMRRGLEIRYCRDIRSYTKLIYSLKEFPEASIITVDDDIIYPQDTIENLLNAHALHPEAICANVLKPIPDDFKKDFKSFADMWISEKHYAVYDRYVQEGYSGVLYPPHSLHEEVFNEDVFMSICKYADDIWFGAMAMLNHTKCVNAHPHPYFFGYVNNPDVQSIALQKVNAQGEQLNEKQFKEVFSKYNLIQI